MQEKKSLEQICSQLERENAELKVIAREAGRKVRQTKWVEQDDKDFLASRKLRREAQSKIKAPIYEHLEKVNSIYNIKNQWCMTNKQHFSLSFPDCFQRAPVLDIRDQNNCPTNRQGNEDIRKLTANREEKDKVKKFSGTGTILSNTSISLNSTGHKLSPKVVEPPAALSALKKLEGKRLKY